MSRHQPSLDELYAIANQVCSEAERDLLALRFAGWRYSQIAEDTGLPPSTVRGRCLRGAAKIANHYAERNDQ